MSHYGGSIGPNTQTILKGHRLFEETERTKFDLGAAILGFTTRAHLYAPALTSALRQVRAPNEQTDFVVFFESEWGLLHADEFMHLATSEGKTFYNPLALVECLHRKPDIIRNVGSCGTLWRDEEDGNIYYLLFASINRSEQSLALADIWSDTGGGVGLTRWRWTPFTNT